MSTLPINSDEVSAFEQRIGIQLPEYYKARLQDPKVRCLFEKVQAIRADQSMMSFANLTEHLKNAHPEFPRDGVVLFCGTDEAGRFNLDWGYLRFMLPEKKNPSRLSETVYTWDVTKRRKSRDCTIQEWLDSTIDCAPDELVMELGLTKQNAFEQDDLEVEPCDPDLQAKLRLRGDAAFSMLTSLGTTWLPCAELAISGAYVSVTDLGQTPSPSSGIKMLPGAYVATVQLSKSGLGDWPVISSFRLMQKGAAQPFVTQEAGVVDVDLAAVAVFDRQGFFKAVPASDREGFTMDLMEISEMPCLVVAGKRSPSPVLVLPSGDGDGTYQIHRLTVGTQNIGLEITFGIAEART